jgi:hypothetical protein
MARVRVPPLGFRFNSLQGLRMYPQPPYLTGASPVTFISEDTGANAGIQYQIPLPLIDYDTTSSSWTISSSSVTASSDITLAQTLILTMINEGLLTVVST